MTTIGKATKKARRERQSPESRDDQSAHPILRPVPLPIEDAENRGEAVRVADAPVPISEPPRSQAPLELLEGRFGPPDEHLVSFVSPDSMESEQYQSIRFTLEQKRKPDAATVLAVTSASSGEGKTLTTLNLAACLARASNTRVLVIDGDLRKPSIAPTLRMKSTSPGVSGVLVRHDCTLANAARHYPLHKIAVLPSGDPSTVPYELFSSSRMETLLNDARRHFDFVIVDLPPMIFPECRVMAQKVDGILVVVRAHKTSRTELKHAIGQLDSSNVLGIIFNHDTQVRSRLPIYYNYTNERS